MTYDANRDRMMQALGARLVEREVIYCVSALVSTLAAREWDGSDGIDADDLATLSQRAPGIDEYKESDELFVTVRCNRLQAYDVEAGDDGFRWTELDPIILDDPAEKGEWFDTELEAWESLFDDQSLDRPDGVEVYEHWIISTWLAARLREAGETVVGDVAGLTIWGRCTTGQAICMDSVIQQIALDAYGEPETA